MCCKKEEKLRPGILPKGVIIPKNIQLIDTITPVSNHTINILKLNNLINASNRKRYVKVFFNGNNLSRKFIGDDYKIRYLKF